jgi:hypothetical protein
MKDEVSPKEKRYLLTIKARAKYFFKLNHLVHFGLIQNEPKDQGCQ